jgi:peptide/nickel transport system substrate-binding protein
MSSSIRAQLLAGAAFAAAVLATQAQAQTIRVANLDAPVNRGEPSGLSYQHTYTWEAMHDGLTTVEGDGRPGPRLALSWENKDPTTWVFKLRPGVTFHAGTPFNADAVVAAINYLMSDAGKATQPSIQGTLRYLTGATKVDDLTVEVKTATPNPIVPAELPAMKIVDPKAWAELGRENFGNKPSGTGPFRVTAWDNTKVEMVRFDGGVRKAKATAVQMYFMPETPTRVQAFASGQVDIAFGVGADAAGPVRNAGGRLNAGPAPSVSVGVINMGKGGWMTDKRVRQAFNYAIDKSYTQTLLGGHTQAASQPASRTVNGYQADIKPYAYDPAKAKALLAEAGFPNGLSLTWEVTTNNADLSNVNQYVAQQLAAVGVKADLKIISLPRPRRPCAGRQADRGRDARLQLRRQSVERHDALDQRLPLLRGAAEMACLPDAEPAIAAVNSEFDPKKRAEGLRKIAQIYHEQAPVVWLYEQYELDALSPKVRNYKNENWRINWADIEIAG